MSDAENNEESLFQTAIVPLKLQAGEFVLWSNTKPNSCHFCRPLSLQYKKETKELSKQEHQLLVKQISELSKFKYELNGVMIEVSAKVDLTMFDGKVVNALTDTLSTQSCNICGAKPSQMNKIDIIHEREVNLEACDLGLSTLHCWIRTFEYILHIGYKNTIKKHHARTPEEKLEVSQQKENIQRKFRENSEKL